MSLVLRTVALVVCSALLGACAETIECDKPKVYQQAVAGKRIEAPEGLDPLAPEREVTVPMASPQAPAPAGSCIDSPPTLRTDS